MKQLTWHIFKKGTSFIGNDNQTYVLKYDTKFVLAPGEEERLKIYNEFDDIDEGN